MKGGRVITRADLKLSVSFPWGILLASAFIFIEDRNFKNLSFVAEWRVMKNVDFQKGKGFFFFFKDHIRIVITSSTALDES